MAPAAAGAGLSTPRAAAWALGMAALGALVLAVIPPSTLPVAAMAGGAIVAVALATTIVFVWRARHDRHRTVWVLLAAGTALLGAVHGIWFTTGLLQHDLPTPSVADALRILGYAFLLSALVESFPASLGWRVRMRLGLDGLVVLASLMVVAWIVALQDLDPMGGASAAALVGTAYPAVDLALGAVLLFLLRELRPAHRPRVLMFGLGLALWLVADMAYAVRLLPPGPAAGLPVDALRVGGYVSFALAAVVRPAGGAVGGTPWSERAWASVVYVPVALVVPTTVIHYVYTRSIDPVLFTFGMTMIAAMVGRQVLYTAEVLSGRHAAQEQAATLREAQAIAHVGSWDFDLRTQDLAISQEAGRIFGIDAREASYEGILATVHPDDRKEVEDAFWRSVEGRTAFAVEHRIVVDGRTKHLVHHGTTEYAGDEPVRSAGTVQDVTERRQAEEQIRFQSHLLENVDHIVVATDLEGRITYWNPVAEKAYGWTRDEVMGRDSADLMPVPESRDEALAVRARLQRGEPWSGVLEVRDRDGDVFIVESRVSPFRDPRGRLAGFLGVAHDITSRKEMEDDLRFQARLLDIVGQAVAATDREGAITYWNAAARRRFGWTDDEIRGRPVFDLIAADRDSEEARRALATLQDGTSWSGDMMMRRKGGTSFLADLRVEPVRDKDGQVTGTIGTVQDITDRRRLESDLRKRVEELRALSGIATRSVETTDVDRMLETTALTMQRAFRHDDAVVLITIGDHAAASGGEPGHGAPLTVDFESDLGRGRIDVAYSQAHDEQAVGPFLEEERALVHTVADILASFAHRVQATAELELRESSLQEAQAMARMGSWTWDPATDETWWSDEMYRIFERQPARGPAGIEEALSFFTEESRPVVEEAVGEAAEEGGSYEVDVDLELPSGTRRSVVSRGHAVRDPEGGLATMAGTVQDITRRKRSERELRFQAEMLAAVGQAVMATDVDGEITSWNPAAERLFGWSRAEAIGRPITAVLGEEQSQVMRSGKRPSADHWIRRKDGRPVLVNLGGNAMMDAEGRPIGFIGIAQDVTEDRATQRRYRDIVEHAPDGLLRTTPAGALEYANPAAAGILGYASAKQMLAEVDSVTDFYEDPEDRKLLLSRLRRQDPTPVQTRWRRRDGSLVWIEIRARMHELPNGEETLEGTIHDLTAQRAREELTQRLAAVVESSAEAIYSVDLEGTVKTWNPAAVRLFGYRVEEAVGKNMVDLTVPEGRRGEFSRYVDHIRAGKAVPRHDTQRMRKDGTRIDVSLAATPLRDASGQVVGATATAHDISDRKAAEQGERARIENEHLKQMDRTLRQFINTVAHDLNQPLTPMKLSLSTLEHHIKGLPDAAQRTVDMVRRSVDRMALLLQDLLDVARLESGTLTFEFADVDLDAILDETGEFFVLQADAEGITLDVERSGLHVAADDRRVIQVLFNLVGNAMKFTPEGGRITVRADPQDGMARVAVTDTGTGLTDGQMEPLFQPFSQVHEKTADAPKGTGLGLYISRGIVEKHGGAIGAQSDGPGKGSTFWFTLPLAGSGAALSEEE